MLKCFKITAFMAISVTFLLFAFAALSGGSAGGSLASGRSVMTHSDSWSLQSRFSADTATIDTAGHTIVVAPKQLIVDGNIVVDIDEATKSVTVNVEHGRINFVADGKPVAMHSR